VDQDCPATGKNYQNNSSEIGQSSSHRTHGTHPSVKLAEIKNPCLRYVSNAATSHRSPATCRTSSVLLERTRMAGMPAASAP
jgi:hypothetical protein